MPANVHTDGATDRGVGTETYSRASRISTETKSSYKTTDLVVFALAGAGCSSPPPSPTRPIYDDIVDGRKSLRVVLSP